MINAAVLEKMEQLPEHVQDEVADFIEFLHQKYVTEVAEDELERTPDGDFIIGYDIDGTPKLASVMKEEYARRLEAVKRGEYITIQQLREESKKW